MPQFEKYDGTETLDISNGKWYTSLGLAMREMGSEIFGKLCKRIGWVVNYEITSFRLILLGGNMLTVANYYKGRGAMAPQKFWFILIYVFKNFKGF